MSAPPQVVFSSDVRNMDEWAKRTGIPLTTADAIGTSYARAHKWLLSIKAALLALGWTDVAPHDPRMLFSIECPSPYRSSSGLPRSPNMRLEIPINASSFFSPERRVQWQMVFHSATFVALRHTVKPIGDLLHVLQCLLTGMLVLVKEDPIPQGLDRTIRALPPADWVAHNGGKLTEVFGSAHYKQLLKAASDNRSCFKLEREFRR
ncbi:hypothetical protein JAAARDRAFT_151657 [Jaapia argillacea MUCL 33604]|uniref:Uncharacterized protein n=1 Tax=Jaapia argillacea MUCL 33604 TaxID=933084 RepID=A0A067QE33_9AGAM|nr:hypothetical protein JAAARDRAFT_151657 [Jaapia argillacea MUCL 33604]